MHINRIAIIGQDERFSEQVEQLLWDRFNISKYFNLSRFLDYVRYNRPDVIVMDRPEDEKSAKDLLLKVRNAVGDIPVIFHAKEEEKITAPHNLRGELTAFITKGKGAFCQLEKYVVKFAHEMELRRRYYRRSKAARLFRKLVG